MDRNLYKMNFRPPSPHRTCLKIMGPLEVSFIRLATIASSGEVTIKRIAAKTTSTELLTKSK